MSHPSSCIDPQCDLSYREHLLGLQISPAALPTRSVTRNEGQADEPTWKTRARERTWERDRPAFKALRQQGYHPRSVEGSADLSSIATTEAQIEGKPEVRE